MAVLNQIAAQVTTVPPEMPSMPTVPGALTDYLRRLSLWMFQQLSAKIPAQTAVARLMLLSPSGVTWQLTVTDNGIVNVTQVPKGSNPT